MAVKFQKLVFSNLVLLFFISVLPCSQGSPQNIEVFYPTQTSPPAPEPISPKPSSTLPIPGNRPDSQPPPETPPSSSDDTNSTIAKAVGATAASTIVIAAIFFFFIRKYVNAQRKKERVRDSFQGGQPRVPPPADEFARVNGNVKGLIVDENGLDVLYWRQLQDGENKNGFRKEILHSPKDEEEGGGGMVRKGSRSKKVEPVQEIPLLRGKSSTSQVPPLEDDDSSEIIGSLPPPPSHGIVLKAVEKTNAPVQSKILPPASMPPSQTPIPPPPLPIQNNKSPVAPPPPPPPAPPNRAPMPPPPPVPVKRPAPPPPPPKAGGSATSLKPPPAARDKSSRGKPEESSGDGSTGNGNNQVKLKPLHWDKVNKNVEHSMVWDKINGGSFK